MADTADIVIVGGGIIGTSIACQLAARGHGRGVVLLERDTLGSGSTGRSAGGIRSQFSTEINIRFSLESVAVWRHFEDLFGTSVDYHEHGYLFLAQTAAERTQFERNIALQNRLGVPSRLLEPSDIDALVPGLRTDDLTAAAYNAEDGGAGPNDATQAFARRARAGGVEIRERSPVTSIEVAEGRVQAVVTAAGRLATRRVVIASGAWAGPVGRLAGVELPVQPYRRELFVSEPFDALPAQIPLVIDLHVGWYVRREGPGVLMSGARDTEPSFNTHVDWGGLPRIAALASHRLPALASARFGGRAWAGLYDVSPDDHAIMGPVPEVDGLYCAVGFSGHGFQHSPAAGRLMAELVLDGRTTGIDIRPLGLERFARGELLHEPLTAHAGSFAG